MLTILLALAALTAGDDAAAQWEAIQCPPHDRQVRLSRYERLTADDPCASHERWQALATDQNALASVRPAPDREGGPDAALGVPFEFVGRDGLEYVAVAPDLAIPDEATHVGLWARCEGRGGSLRVRIVDASGECHQRDFERIEDEGWHVYVTSIERSPQAWGGDGNRRLDRPLRLWSIVLDKPEQGYAGEGVLTLDELQLLREREVPDDLIEVSILEGHFGNLFAPGDPVAFRVRRGAGAPGARVRVAWRLQDFWGEELAAGEFVAEDAPHVLETTADRWGYFVYLLDLIVDGELLETLEARFGVLPERDSLADVEASPFGACTHYHREHWSLESMPMMVRAGIKYLRDEVPWSHVEREKGSFEFPPRKDEYIDRAVELGIEPLLILDYGNEHYDEGNYPTSDEAIAGFARYCYETAKHFRGRVRYFEIWNEWTIGCGMGGRPGNEPENYPPLLAAAEEAVRRANPDAVVIGIGGEHSLHGREHIATMFDGGALQHMDAVSVHSYRYPRTPEATDLAAELLSIGRLIAEHGGDQPIWVSEIGWPTHLGTTGSPEPRQARMLVRSMVEMLATGIVDRIFWYDFKDDALNRRINEHSFGIIRHEHYHCAVKPAYLAYAALTRMLRHAEFAGEMQIGDEARAYRFQRPGEGDVIVAWTAGREPTRVTVQWQIERCVDMMGNQRRLERTDEGTALELTGAPTYLILQAGATG
ncbi:MAG: hypothetical protein ACP5KN_01510 [Armatimonadota bacterium]